VANLILIDYILIAIAGWIAIGVFGLVKIRQTDFVAQVIFPLGGVLGIFLGTLGLIGVFAPVQTELLPLGLPGLPFHVRLDTLSSYFLFVLGIVSTGVSFFSAGYFNKEEDTPAGLICLEYHLCLACMAMLLIADDAYVFMMAWELMSLTATFLVIANHRDAEVRYAGFLYFLIAHVGALALVLCFGILGANTGDYTFAGIRLQQLNMFWASIVFFLSLIGFGAKAGILPLHIWLPEAHPAAPSPISALMSAFVLKTGIYGILRMTFDLLHTQDWKWGGITLALGLATALFGVVLSTVQTDMKRLLAYSSIENIGLILAGIGLTILFSSYGMAGLAALSLTAALFHVASHAAFKSLLFLGTGSVLHSTGERNLGRLGGLMRFMPWTAWPALVGALAAGGLPPFGGFVSEWLLLQSFLFTPGLPNSFLNMLIPIVTAVIVLVGALAAYVMVKFFGIIFLGQPRERKLNEAHDAGIWERMGFSWLVVACICFGLLPVHMARMLDRVTHLLVGDGIGAAVTAGGWLLLVPDTSGRASYMPVVFVMVLLACCVLAYVIVHRVYHGRSRRSGPWACGFPFWTARMQDTAEGFGQPIRHVFGMFFRMTRKLPSEFDKKPYYEIKVEDPFWSLLYRPIAATAGFVSSVAGLLQHGRIAVYLLYSFLTLMFLLLVINQ